MPNIKDSKCKRSSGAHAFKSRSHIEDGKIVTAQPPEAALINATPELKQ